MAFFRHVYRKISNKWYPSSKLMGSQITLNQLAKRISQESTASPADTLAVLKALSSVMGEYMAMGRSVKLDGIGSFYFQAICKKTGVPTSEEVSARQITRVKIRFQPERTFDGPATAGSKATRSLADTHIEWIDLDAILEAPTNNGSPTQEPGDEPGDDQGGNSGDNNGGGSGTPGGME